MKHLKTYEGLIKHNDSRVINNPLNPIINSIVELLTKLSELDGITGSKIKTFYTEETVTITYTVPPERGSYGTINLFEIRFYNYIPIFHRDEFSLKEIAIFHDMTYSNLYINRDFVRNELYKFMKDNFLSDEDYHYGGKPTFRIGDFDDIINGINKISEELEFKANIKKYNL